MKKKIAILYSGAEVWGGIETYLWNLLSGENKEIDFYLLSMGEWELTEKLKDKVIVKVFGKARINPFKIIQIGLFLRKRKITLFVSQGVVSSAYAWAVSLFFRVPNLCIVHSDLREEYKNLFAKNAYLFLNLLFKNITKKYIAVSEYIKDVLVERGVEVKKIKVIYNGVKLNLKEERKRQGVGSKEHKGKSEKFIVGSVGRLNYEKGYDLLVKASKYLPKNVEIRICGEGSERKNLINLIEKNKLGKKVKLLGFCKEIAEFYKSLDLYIQPSRSEGFGLTVVEAMFEEIPVIVSSRGALPELVDFGKQGIVMKQLDEKNIIGSISEAIAVLGEIKERAIKQIDDIKERFDFNRWLAETIKELLR